MGMLKGSNAAGRFALEVAALVTLAYWGFQAGSPAARVGLGVGVPLGVATTWAMLGSPKAPYRLPRRGRLVLETAIFGAAVWALWDSGHPAWALGLAAAVIVNTALLLVWRQ